jgi:hypothetical protein
MPVIEARKKRFRAQEYTSARLKTQGLHDWTHGYHDRPNGRSYHYGLKTTDASPALLVCP